MRVRLPARDVGRLFEDPAVAALENDLLFIPQLKQSTAIIKSGTLALNRDVTGLNQLIAVIDSGVDKTHPMLAGKVVDEACFSSRSAVVDELCPNGRQRQVGMGAGINCPTALKGCEHGTHVAAIAAGRSPTRQGVAVDAGIIAIQVAGEQFAPSTGGCTPQPCVAVLESNVLAALDFVYENQEKYEAAGKAVAAVNMSLGLGSEQHAVHCADTSPHVGLDKAMRSLRQAGIATIVSAGNSSLDGFVNYPSCLPEAIAVGATNDDDVLWIFGNLGPLVKLLAPGADITSAVPEGSACASGGARTCELSGTSQAAPHVSGALALLRSSKPEARITEMLAALNCTGRPIQGYDAYHQSNKYHRPRINVLAAEAHISNPDGDESFRFSATAGNWNPVLGSWTVADGNLRTDTTSWPTASPWGMASLAYCRDAFEVVARMKQRDPNDPDNTPLETGLLLASHITTFLGTTRAAGHLFIINSAGGGSWAVKRIDDKMFSTATFSDEVTLCSGTVADLKLDKIHELKAVVGEGAMEFFLDGASLCAITRKEQPPRYAPPAKIALVARRGITGTYSFMVDAVTITAR
jgi:subtilisin family serine protease